MRKIRLLIEYDGTDYHGWQIQKKGMTVQGILEERILIITGENTRVVGAGRTDAGVHALGQVAAFRTDSGLDIHTFKKALNANLPGDIRILDITEVDDSFNPRDDAVRKSYLYVIQNEKKSSVFVRRYSALVKQKLDLPSMVTASQSLIGRHNFSSFMGTGSSVKISLREIFSLTVEQLEKIDFMTTRLNGNFIRIHVEADGFLRHMVRNIVGTLIETGRGRIEPAKIKVILESHDRTLAGPTAPANGLFLEKIVY